MKQLPGERRPLTAPERQALRERSEQLRQRARAIVAQSAALQAKHEEQRLRHESQFDALGEVRARLCELVTDYTSVVRRLEIAPEGAVTLVKECVSDSIACLPVEAQSDLSDDVVWWTIESYFAA